MEPDSQKEELPLEGLSNAHAIALERFPIRTRESSATLSAWRLEITTDGGEGTIYLVEISPGWAIFRGGGVLLGWPQPRLEAVYHALKPASAESSSETLQLG
jgi:hypothetical protein